MCPNGILVLRCSPHISCRHFNNARKIVKYSIQRSTYRDSDNGTSCPVALLTNEHALHIRKIIRINFQPISERHASPILVSIRKQKQSLKHE